jgi:hypothetical protein
MAANAKAQPKAAAATAAAPAALDAAAAPAPKAAAVPKAAAAPAAPAYQPAAPANRPAAPANQPAEPLTLESLAAQVQLQGRLLGAHDSQLMAVVQSLDLDFLLVSDTAKQEVQLALGNGEAKGKGVRAFRAVITRMVASAVAGTTRLDAASDSSLRELVLRFKSPFQNPLQARPWKFTLAVSTSASADLRGALGDLAASGGCENILVRRPLAIQGNMARQVEEWADPVRALNRANKGKDKGRGKGRGNGNGKGKAQAKAGDAVPAMAPPPGAPAPGAAPYAAPRPARARAGGASASGVNGGGPGVPMDMGEAGADQRSRSPTRSRSPSGPRLPGDAEQAVQTRTGA